ncbi:MAG: class I SAM-dependent methyltransferase [Bacteriovoracaceae bacterium]|nr:class I SAM-dependent methyltransferase [Bacteriovoracaceae bacterium]
MDGREIDAFRKKASLESAGSSSDKILDSFIEKISRYMSGEMSLIDIGCGQGSLLRKVHNLFPKASLTGVDYTNFEDYSFPFFQHDCNKDFSSNFSEYDIVLASEVIEHLENPRHFLRQLTKITRSGGYIIISTPNLESITSLISFIIRGYHSAFGGRSYPAHITPVGVHDLTNMINEINGLNLLEIEFVANGRMPGISILWQNIIPFLIGKRFSDNYVVVIKKI